MRLVISLVISLCLLGAVGCEKPTASKESLEDLKRAAKRAVELDAEIREIKKRIEEREQAAQGIDSTNASPYETAERSTDFTEELAQLRQRVEKLERAERERTQN